jgi:hypothetical protein
MGPLIAGLAEGVIDTDVGATLTLIENVADAT